jgi:hypothetical protein
MTPVHGTGASDGKRLNAAVCKTAAESRDVMSTNKRNLVPNAKKQSETDKRHVEASYVRART